MSRNAIYTHISALGPESNGSGERWRLAVAQKVFAGNKPVMDREVVMILNREETLQLAMDLVGKLPPLWLAEPQQNGRLKPLVEILPTVSA